MSSRLRTECPHRDDWYDLPLAPQYSSLTAVQPARMDHHLSLGFLAFFSYRMKTGSPVTVPAASVPPIPFPQSVIYSPESPEALACATWAYRHSPFLHSRHDSSLDTPPILNISIAHMTRQRLRPNTRVNVMLKDPPVRLPLMAWETPWCKPPPRASTFIIHVNLSFADSDASHVACNGEAFSSSMSRTTRQ